MGGLAAGYYFHEASIERRIPVFAVAAQHTDIFTAVRGSSTPLRVLRADGQAVTNDVTAVRWYLWNAGRRSIKSADVLDPLRIALDDLDGRILDFKIVKASRPMIGAALQRAESDPNRVLLLTFRILERDDGVVGEIIYEGNRHKAVTLGGAVEGVAAFTSPASLARERRPASVLKLIFGLVAAVALTIAAMGLLALIIFLLSKIPGLESLVSGVMRRIGTRGFVVVVILALLFALYRTTIDEEETAKRQPAIVAPRSLAE